MFQCKQEEAKKNEIKSLKTWFLHREILKLQNNEVFHLKKYYRLIYYHYLHYFKESFQQNQNNQSLYLWLKRWSLHQTIQFGIRILILKYLLWILCLMYAKQNWITISQSWNFALNSQCFMLYLIWSLKESERKRRLILYNRQINIGQTNKIYRSLWKS